jgi:hypothetical protein
MNAVWREESNEAISSMICYINDTVTIIYDSSPDLVRGCGGILKTDFI